MSETSIMTIRLYVQFVVRLQSKTLKTNFYCFVEQIFILARTIVCGRFRNARGYRSRIGTTPDVIKFSGEKLLKINHLPRTLLRRVKCAFMKTIYVFEDVTPIEHNSSIPVRIVRNATFTVVNC